jgi:hypothetical protein
MDMRRLFSWCLRAFVSGAVFLHLSAANAQSGGPYDLSGSTIDVGGVSVTFAGAFTLGGTAGQPDAGTNAGGPYELAGGFWPGDVLATPAPECVGNCNSDHAVTVNEIITMVNIALGSADISTCTAGDANADDTITINEIIAAVNDALTACPAS